MSVPGPAPLSSPVRMAVHAVIVVLGWALLVFGWLRVAAYPWEAPELRLLIVASAVVLPLLTGLWIVHNVALYRGRLRRSAASQVEARYDTDWVGRTVEADWVALADARAVRIDVDGHGKRFVDETSRWQRSGRARPLQVITPLPSGTVAFPAPVEASESAK